MNSLALDDYRDVMPDGPDASVPTVTWQDKEMLNRQSGFNRSLLESYETCGCFHCGHRFPTSIVSDWMIEDGEEDTGVCPYCGKDTLIVGTESFPLSTALLTRLYEEWFDDELKELDRDRGLRALPYHSREEYLRLGIPFRMEPVDPGYWERVEKARRWEILERGGSLRINVWSVGFPGVERWDCEGAPLPGNATGNEVDGTWFVRAYEDDDGIEHFELERADDMLRFSPWMDREQAALLELSARYGMRLKGDLTSNGDHDISLNVFLEQN